MGMVIRCEISLPYAPVTKRDYQIRSLGTRIPVILDHGNATAKIESVKTL